MRLFVNDLQPGQDYKIQVRSNDGQAVSEWTRLYEVETIIDDIAPTDPFNLVVIQNGTSSVVTWDHSGANTDSSVMKDFAYFEVEAYSDGVTAFYQTGVENLTFTYEYNVTVFGLYKSNVGFRVRIVDQSGNESGWTTRVFGIDTDPEKPSDPILLKQGDIFFVRHDLKDDTGARLDTDVDKLRVYVASDLVTPIATIAVRPSDVFAVSGTFTYAAYVSESIVVVAEDIGGNVSPASDAVAVTSATPGLFADYAVINVAFIDYLEANKLVAGSGIIDNIVVKSSLILGASRDGSAPTDEDGNAIPITETVVRSANYEIGTTGWIIRGDGYAEFRNLAVNSLNIGKFDYATQTMLATRFSDFMEDSALWGRHTTDGEEEEEGGTPYETGVFAGVSDSEGAYTAKSLIQMTGKTSIRRKSNGLNAGIPYDPSLVYKITARLRQLTGPNINFLSNPNAYRATTGAGLADFWASQAFWSGGGVLTVSVASTPVRSGTTSQKVSHTSLPKWTANNGHTGVEPSDSSHPIVVTGGKTYTASVYMYLQTGSNVKGTIVLATYDAAGSSINPFFGGPQITLVAGQWTRVTSTYTAESNAAKIQMMMLAVNTHTGAQTVEVFMDEAMVTETPSVVSYFDGATSGSTWNGAANASPSQQNNEYKYRVGVLGIDIDGDLCAADGTTSDDPADHYMVAADAESNLALFEGSPDEVGGWVEVSGYLGGKDVEEFLPPSQHLDPYDPAPIHFNVTKIVPFIQVNIDDVGASDIGLVAELDAFTIEASNTLTPKKISTASGDFSSGIRAITIEDVPDDDFGHMIRWYSGGDDEIYPALMTEYEDATNNLTHTIMISPPQTFFNSYNPIRDAFKIRGKNANMLYNSSFEQTVFTATTDVHFDTERYAVKVINGTMTQDDAVFHEGFGNRSLKLTSTALGYCFAIMRIKVADYPDMLGTFDLTSSVFARTTYDVDVGSSILTKDADNTEIWTSGFGVENLYPDSDVWYRYVQEAALTSSIDEDIVIIELQLGFYATGAGQVVYFDDAQLEVGLIGPFKPQMPTTFRMPGAGTVVGGSLVVGNTITTLPQLPTNTWKPGIDFVPRHTSIFIENQGSTGIIEKVATDSNSYMGFRITDAAGANSGPIIYMLDGADTTFPNTILIYNTSQQLTMRIGSNVDPTNPEVTKTAKDLHVYGSLRVDGKPNWVTPVSVGTNVTSFASTQSIASQVNNGIVTLRGLIDVAGNINQGATLLTLPVGHRPLTQQYLTAGLFDASVAAQYNAILIVNTDGTVVLSRARLGAGPPMLTSADFIPLNGLNFTIGPTATVPNADGSNPVVIGAATSPSTITITAYASGTANGTYKLSWTNPNDTDNDKLRIVWRIDRAPTSSTDGWTTVVQTVNNAAQTFLLGNLPVNRTIYIKAYSLNKAGIVAASGSSTASRYLLASPLNIRANSTGSWHSGSGGVWRTDGDAPIQGEWSGNNDVHRGLWFYGTLIRDYLLAGGLGTARIPTKIQMAMLRRPTGGLGGGASINLFPHLHTTKPAGIPSIVVTGRPEGSNIVNLNPSEGIIVTVPAAWYSLFADGTYKGMAIYDASGDYAPLTGKGEHANTGNLTIYHRG